LHWKKKILDTGLYLALASCNSQVAIEIYNANNRIVPSSNVTLTSTGTSNTIEIRNVGLGSVVLTVNISQYYNVSFTPFNILILPSERYDFQINITSRPSSAILIISSPNSKTSFNFQATLQVLPGATGTGTDTGTGTNTGTTSSNTCIVPTGPGATTCLSGVQQQTSIINEQTPLTIETCGADEFCGKVQQGVVSYLQQTVYGCYARSSCCIGTNVGGFISQGITCCEGNQCICADGTFCNSGFTLFISIGLFLITLFFV